MILGIVACGSSASELNSYISTNTPSLATKSKSLTPLGTSARVRKDRSIIVEGSEEMAQITANNRFIDPVKPKGGKLIVVYMTMGNTGNESGNMTWTEFQLVDSQERTYDVLQDLEEFSTVYMWLKEKGLEDSSTQIFPGGTAQTAKVFRVASDANDLKLVVNRKKFAIQ